MIFKFKRLGNALNENMDFKKGITELLPPKQHEFFFFVSTEYQILQAHLLRYEFNRFNTSTKGYHLLILDNGRITDELIVNGLWSTVSFLPVIPDKSYIYKVNGYAYKKCIHKYRTALSKIGTDSSKERRVYFFANDEKIENAILQKLIFPRMTINLEDGSGNYNTGEISKSKYLLYAFKYVLLNDIFKLNLSFVPHFGYGHYDFVVRSNPQLVSDNNVIDLRVLFKKYAIEYANVIKKNYNFGYIRPEILYISDDFDYKEMLKLEKIGKVTLIKPHPTQIVYFEKYRKLFNKSSRLIFFDSKISAELLPLLFPSIDTVIIKQYSTLLFTLHAFYPNLNIQSALTYK